MFFKTLSQLSDLGIKVLNLYSFNFEETANDIVNQLKIFYEQLRLLKEKLEKFGLLQSKNEKVNKDNL